MDYWSIGILGKTKLEQRRLTVEVISDVGLSAFSPLFQHSILPFSFEEMLG